MRHLPTAGSRRARGPLTATVTTLLLAGLFTMLLGAGTASAEAYRFWGFYQWTDGAWSLASKGPASATPADGAVEGWRLAVSGEKTPPRVPRADGDFDQICDGTAPEPGQKRVAVVLDYGLAAEEPSGKEPPEARGECAVVDTAASSAQVLAAVAEVREAKSLICAIDAFPPTGCGDPVAKDPTVESPEPAVSLVLPAAATQASEPAGNEPRASDEESGSGGGFPVWSVAGAVVVVGLVLGAYMIRRSRKADARDG